jgi:glycosyltransferase Alg8
MLTASGHRIGPSFPLLLFYNQICGALTKIYVFFHLDQQSWTRQKTTLARNLDDYQRRFNRWSSTAMMWSAASVFALVVLRIV